MKLDDVRFAVAENAQTLGVSAAQAYMGMLRMQFCITSGISKEDYGLWLERVFPHVTWEHNLLFLHSECSIATDIRSLLAMGDVFAHNRAETGSFYTPVAISQFMAKNSLFMVMSSKHEKEFLLFQRHCNGEALGPEEAAGVQGLLKSQKIIDIACGNGIFLNAFIKIYRQLAVISREDCSAADFVRKALYGTDMRTDALESWAISACCEMDCTPWEMPVLNGAVVDSVMGDALVESAAIKAVLSEGGFDLVIGNPPYLGEKGNGELFRRLKNEDFGRKYYEGRMDLFYYFLHRALDISADNGVVCQLTTSYYATADYAGGLRTHLKQAGGIAGLVNFGDQKVFPDAGGHHLILFHQKGIHSGPARVTVYEGSKKMKDYDFSDLSLDKASETFCCYTVENRALLFDARGHMVLNPIRWELPVIEGMEAHCADKLRDLVQINQGIVSGMDRCGASGVFVLNPDEITDELLPWLVPWYKNSDIRRYATVQSTEKRLLYIDNDTAGRIPESVRAHLRPFKTRLASRRECVSGSRPWCALQWPRERRIFEGEKLVVPQRATENRFAYHDGPWYASADVYFLTSPISNVSLKALVAYLNSDAVYQWLMHCGKRKGGQMELYATPLGNIPVDRRWFCPGGGLDVLGEDLFRNAEDAVAVEAIRRQVDCWIEKELHIESIQ